MIAAALAAGIRVIGEVELGWRLLEHEFVALTGSNGKTTTVELIGHVYRMAGLPVTVAGNVGTALTSLPGTLEPGTTVVCEVSSFQLEDTEAFAPEAAVLLNLAEDHLDRHGTFDNYRAAKLEIFAHQPPGTVAVVPAGLALDDAGGAADRITFGEAADRDAGPRPSRRHAVLARRAVDGGRRHPHPRPAQPRERDGRGGGLSGARRARRTRSSRVCAAFAGVPHRLEEIGTVDGVLYVNDSKATNVASAEVAINSFAGGVHLIAGGRGKGSDYAPLAAPVRERCRAVYVIGETAAALHDALLATDGSRSPTRATSSGRSRPRTRRPSRVTSCCSRRAARRMTSTAPTRSAGTTSARSSPRCADPRALSGRQNARPPHEAREAEGVRARHVEWRCDGATQAAAARAPLAAHRHLLPARGRGRDGVLGLLGAHDAAGRRSRAPRTCSSTWPTGSSA